MDAADRCLKSWRSRSLSYSGKALVANSLALSRVWYVASLVHIPAWVCAELKKLLFNFFWSGRRDLVARKVLIHPKESGGFSVVSIDFKVAALLIQWVCRLVVCPNGWVHLLTYWLLDRHGVTPFAFFSDPFSFLDTPFPPFYYDLFQAWRAAKGGASPSGLTLGSLGSNACLFDSISCKSAYSFLLSLNPAAPHCVSKFFPSFGRLDWSSTSQTIFLLPLDRRVSNLSWLIAHRVLYTAARLASFGYSLQTSCFCGYQSECLEHLFFACPLVQSGYAWIGTKLSHASPLAPSIDVRHALFGFSRDEMRSVPRVFAYLLNVCKYLVWVQRSNFRFRSVPPSAARLVAAIKARLCFYLPLLFKRFLSNRRRRFFVCQWAGNGIFGSISSPTFVCSV